MRRVTFWLLCLFVFAVPWEFLSAGIAPGAVTRASGLAVAAAGLLAMVISGRLRKPGPILVAALLFVAVNVLSLFWTVSTPSTVERVATYVQLLFLIWMMWEFAETIQDQRRLMAAYCLGAFIPIANVLWNYSAGVRYDRFAYRFSATGLNADDLGLMLVLGIPMAWHLLMKSRGLLRIPAAAYCPLALVGLLLTGTRGASVAAVVALAIIPLTVSLRTPRSLLLAAAIAVAAIVAMASVVPAESWQRILSTRNEIAGRGTLTGRMEIWAAGWEAFSERPLLGAGAGAFPAATTSMLADRHSRSAHNILVAVIVEEGLVGLSLFVVLLATCALTIARLPAQPRAVWAVLMLAWLVGGMSVSWEYRKPTWVLFGLLGAQGAAYAEARRVAPARARVRVVQSFIVEEA